MSTKLYEAFKLPKMTITVFFKKVELLKKEMNKLVQKEYEEALIKECLEIYDHMTVFPESNVFYKNIKNSHANIMRIVNDKMDYQNGCYRKKSFLQLFYANIQFYEYKGIMYAIPRARKTNEINKLIKRITKAKSYGYWNNTDRPSGLSQREWKEREKEWDNVFGNKSWDTSNAKNNLKLEVSADVFKYNSSLHSLKMKHNIQKILNHPHRGLRIAESLSFDKESQKKHSSVWSYIASEEYKSNLRKELSKIKNKLNKTINLEDLLSKEVPITNKDSENSYSFFIDED